MTIARTLERYLDAKHVEYYVIAHPPTHSSMETVETCHIPGDRLAKGVLLRDEVGYALAVLPASHHIRLSELRRQFGDDVQLASEREIEDLFEDCVRGAIPAVGECYGLDMVVDESIEEQPEIYFEGGDHTTLVRMSRRAFADLIGVAKVNSVVDIGKLEFCVRVLDQAKDPGVPLLEIVTEPDINSAEEAEAYARKLRAILQYLGVNDGDMSKGVLRVEPNISVRHKDDADYRTRLGREARDYAQREFTWSAVAGKYLEIYQSGTKG